jgi:hypothetical protein
VAYTAGESTRAALGAVGRNGANTDSREVAERISWRRADTGVVALTKFEERAYRLLEVFYELSGANPMVMVFSDKAAREAGIPYVMEEYAPLATYLKRFGLIKEVDSATGLHVFRITPAGIRAVEQDRVRTTLL